MKIGVERNPVRAGLAESPQDWLWCSANAHIKGVDDILVKAEPLNDMVSKPWVRFLKSDVGINEIDFLRKHERTGRPLGDETFIKMLENILDRRLKPRKPGPKPNKDK